MMEKNSSPKVSIIIPTFNSADTLGRCLESIEEQTYTSIETIIVDNFSDDETVNIAQNYEVKIIQKKSGMPKARNIGIKNSTGKIIFSVDSDMQLRKGVVDKGVKKIQKGYDAVVIPEISIGEGFWVGVKGFKKLLHLGDLLFESPRMFSREVLEKVGGYDPNLLDGEDYDLHIRIRRKGFKIDYISAIIEHIEGKVTLYQWLQEKHKYGKTTSKFKKKHPEIYKKKSAQRFPTLLLNNWKKIKQYPHFTFGLLLFKTLSILPWKFEVPPDLIIPSALRKT